VKGNERWGAVHRGQTYLFAGPEEQQAFLANPDQFSPVLAGMDVVALAAEGRVVQGHREFGVLYDDDGKGPRPNRIYLFDSAGTRDRFEATPESYVQPVLQALRQNQLQTLVR
jgi:YHS domain-containing protein